MSELTRKQRKRRIEIGASRGMEAFELIVDFCEFLGYEPVKNIDKHCYEFDKIKKECKNSEVEK